MIAEYCIAYISLLAIATLRSPVSCLCLALPCLASPCLASPRLALPCLASPRLALPRLASPCVFSSVLILARVSWINPLPSHSDSVCTSLGLLLVYLDYLSALPCWILFADRRPMLALGVLFVLPVIFLFAITWTLLVLWPRLWIKPCIWIRMSHVSLAP